MLALSAVEWAYARRYPVILSPSASRRTKDLVTGIDTVARASSPCEVSRMMPRSSEGIHKAKRVRVLFPQTGEFALPGGVPGIEVGEEERLAPRHAPPPGISAVSTASP